MSLEQLYVDYNIEMASEGLRHYRSGWINTPCPHCTGGDGYHLGYNIQGNYYFCWRCGKHNTKYTISKLLGVSQPQADRLLTEYNIEGAPVLIIDQKDKRIGKMPFTLPTDVTKLKKVHRKYLEKRNFDPDYLQKVWHVRGTSPTSKVYTEEKTLTYKYRVLIPIYWNDKLVSFQCRDYTGKQDPKYKACPMEREIIHHKYLLYGDQSEWTDVGVLVEGVFDVWRLGGRAAATLGMQYTDQQLKIMTKIFSRIFVLFDPGHREQQEAEIAVARLQAFGVDAVAYNDLPSDPGDMDPDDAKHLMRQLK